MATQVITYKGLLILKPDPTEAGGQLIQTNFKNIADSLQSIQNNITNINTDLDSSVVDITSNQTITGSKKFQNIKITTAGNQQVLMVNANGKIVTTGKTVQDIINDAASPDLSDYYTKSQVNAHLAVQQAQVTDNANEITDLNSDTIQTINSVAPSGNNVDIVIDGFTASSSGDGSITYTGSAPLEILLNSGEGIYAAEISPNIWTISVSGDYAVNSLVQTISADLQSQIDSIDEEATNLFGGEGISVVEAPTNTWTIAVSSDYARQTVVENISANLQSQIDSFESESTIILEGKGISVTEFPADTWTISAEIDELGSGTKEITSNETFIPSINDTYTLGTSAKSWAGLWLNGSEISVDSGTLTVDGVEISGSGGSGGSDVTLIGGEGIQVVEAPTDTWTISVSGDYATNTLVQNISGDLQSQIDSITGSSLLQGSVECDTVNKTYLITHDDVDSNSVFPMISLTVPSSASLLYVQGIHDINDSSFKVTLSDIPATSGYEINWLLGSSNILTSDSSTLEDEIGTGTKPITSNESIIPAISGTYDLGSVSKPWKELHLIGDTIYMGGRAISVNNNRLKFDNIKTLAYTDDVSGSYTILQTNINNVKSLAERINESTNFEYTSMIQESHGLSVLDPVKIVTLDDNGPFVTEKSRSVTNNETYPYYEYDSNNKEYTIGCLGRGWGISQDDINYYSIVKTKSNIFGDLSIKTKDHVGWGEMGLVILDPSDNDTATFMGIRINGGDCDEVYKNKVINGDGEYPGLDKYDVSGDIDLRIETYDVGNDNVGVKFYYKNSSSETWSQLGGNVDTGIDANSYYVGIYCQGRGFSPENSLVSKVYDIAGSLGQGGSSIAWQKAGGSSNKSDFADGVVIEVSGSDTVKIATAGIITKEDSFTAGRISYLSQNTEGSETYNRPSMNPQELWVGIDENNAKLILTDKNSSMNTSHYGDSVSILPENEQSNLGNIENNWNTLYVNSIELSGQDLNNRISSLETEVDAISGGIDYSTDETYIGHSWIDGSRIYRKVVEISSKPNAGSENTATGISDFDIVVDARLIFNASGARMILSSSNVNNTIDDEHFFVNGTDIVWHSPFDRTSVSYAYCIIEYTKT